MVQTSELVEEKRTFDEKSIDEKVIEAPSISSVDFRHGDEALKLIDAENAVIFSEEYNLKLRKKLVRPTLINTRLTLNSVCQPLGHVNPSPLCCCLLHPILV
jgi:hypothetical protein